MPELAEVEYFRTRWNLGVGHKIQAVELHASKRIFRGAEPAAISRKLTGAKLLRSEAAGKQLLFAFSGGGWLGIHLGMTGELTVKPAGPKRWAARTASRTRPGYVAAIVSACSRAP